MRKNYRFTIPKFEQENFHQVLKHLGLNENSVVTSQRDQAETTCVVVVPVSKYELLYIRLSCSYGSYVNIEAFNNKEKRKQMEQEIKKAKLSA